MIAANKQNLLLLKKQQKNLNNGLRLLKEKRSGLIILFLNTAREGKVLEQKLNTIWQMFLKLYTVSTSLVSNLDLSKGLENLPATNLNVEKKRITGVYIENFNLQVKPPQRLDLKSTIRDIFHVFGKIFPDFVKLAQLKSNCLKISKEIIKTNRQINNLENKVLQTAADIKYINSALQEKANSEKAVLIKIFG